MLCNYINFSLIDIEVVFVLGLKFARSLKLRRPRLLASKEIQIAILVIFYWSCLSNIGCKYTQFLTLLPIHGLGGLEWQWSVDVVF